MNISGGTFARSFQSGSFGSVSGGLFDDAFFVGPLAFSGGSFANGFTGIDVELVGGEFRLNGEVYNEDTINLSGSTAGIFTGTLADGSAFIFNSNRVDGIDSDSLTNVTLSRVQLPIADTGTQFIVNATASTGTSLRSGQSAVLLSGEVDNFEAVDATFALENGTVRTGANIVGGVTSIQGGDLEREARVFGADDFSLSGGSIGDNFQVFNSEIDVTGGTIAQDFLSQSSTINVSGGSIGRSATFVDSELNVTGGDFSGLNTQDSNVNISGGTFQVFSGAAVVAEAGSVFDIQGGTFVDAFAARSGSVVTVSGGRFENEFNALSGSQVDISGGVLGGLFRFSAGSDVELIGGEFFLNGAAFNGNTISLSSFRDDVFSGTLQDGTPFILTSFTSDFATNLRLTNVAVPTIANENFVVDSTNSESAPLGLRTGQTLTVRDGGLLDAFDSVGGSVFVEGGTLAGVDVLDGSVNVSGGVVQQFTGFAGSRLDVSGGEVGRVEAFPGGEINVSGGSVGFADLENSVLNIEEGFVGTIRVRDNSTVIVSGGGVGEDSSLSGGTLDISGGNVGDSLTGSFGATINISGGSIGDGFDLRGGVNEGALNISGGRIGNDFTAFFGYVVNISGGSVGNRLTIGDTANISGGTVGNDFTVFPSGTVNISGGIVGNNFEAQNGSEINISGGNVGNNFDAGLANYVAAEGSEINISGGSVGNDFNANSGSEVNVSGGSVGARFDANDGSQVVISGGEIGNSFNARSGSNVTVSGGEVGSFFRAFTGSEVDISGGTFGLGTFFQNGSTVVVSGGRFGSSVSIDADSDAQLVGGEFKLNGQAFTDSTITLTDRDVFTGTLADGTTFIFDREERDFISDLALTNTALAAIRTDPIVVDSADFSGRNAGLRAGERLILRDGGELGNTFEVVEGTIDVEGGNVGDAFSVVFGTANISGGNIGEQFTAGVGSEVNISGGEFGSFGANLNSSVNLTGTEFFIDGVELDLIEGDLFAVTDRNIVLSGTLLDGSDFEFFLDSNLTDQFFDPTASVSLAVVAAVPEPSGLAMLFGCGVSGLLVRRRK